MYRFRCSDASTSRVIGPDDISAYQQADFLDLAYFAYKREAAGKPTKPQEIWELTVEEMTIVSTELIDEMKTIVRDGGSILASGRNKDDRVMATALACAAYAEQLQPRLIAQKITRNVSRTQEDSTPEQIVVGRTVSDYLKRIGVYGQ